jgi:hypothetical protein
MPDEIPVNPTLARTFWSTKGQLQMYEEAQLPLRCIKCNRATNTPPVRLKLSWVDPDIAKEYRPYRFIPLIRLLAMMMQALRERRTRRFATVHVSLCRYHRLRPKIATAIQVIAILAAFALFYTATQTWTQAPAVGAAVAILIAITATLFTKPPITALHIDNQLITVKGASPAFLASLPQDLPPAPAPRARLNDHRDEREIGG